MRRHKTTRKARFEAALKLAGSTMRAFAEEHEISPAHLHYVITGVRESERVNALIDQYIAKYLSAAHSAA
jgi:hypothetical protein